MTLNIFEWFDYPPNSLLLVGEFNMGMVVLSLTIAIFASFMAFQVASQASKSLSPLRKQVSLLVGSITLGGGVWSMHFIGMLAFELCSSVSYNWGLTILSLVPAVAASWVALNFLVREKVNAQQLILGGVLMGAGVGTMHYIGMAAMEMAPLLRYDLTMFVVSIVVAVVLAILSLWTRFGLEHNFLATRHSLVTNTIASIIMGLAIAGMHYTGMAAARFVMPEGLETLVQTNEISMYLAFTVTIITVIIIVLVLAFNVVFQYKDISAEARLNEKRLIATMDTAIDGIVTIDETGIVTSVNKAVEILLGWSQQEIVGQNVKMLVPETIRSNHDSFIKQYLKTRNAKIIGQGRDVEAVCKNGQLIPIRLALGHAEFNGKHLFVGFISDLRARIEMETALRDNEAKISSLMSNIPGVVYRAINTEGWPHIFISDEVKNVTGYPAEDFILPNPTRHMSDFIHPEDIELIAQTDLTSPSGFILEFRLIDRFGQTKWMLGHGRIIKSTHNEEEYVDGFIMDISQRKKMEEALVLEKDKAKQAVATRSAFLANMSHEIRTPMNAIIGFSDILLDSQLDKAQYKHLNTINQSAKSLMHILNDILDSAKLEKGKFQLEYRDFSLVEEIDAVVSTLWLLAQEKDIPIKLDVDSSIAGYYNGVPDRLRQVLTNLLGNAVKFTTSGEIVITVTQVTPQDFKFIIKDTGIGMTPEQMESVFDAFSQADESMSRRFGGTGLGTTISKQLVELMGGKIYVESELGLGSTFSFDIPLTKATDVVNVTELEPEQVPLPPLTVLVVDDIEQNIELLSIILKRDGHTICTARDGEQALERMKTDHFDIVLMDIQMPVLDGLSAAKARRKFELETSAEHVPIIALTASVLEEDKLSAEQAGMEGFANKPINIAQLRHEIARVLNLNNVDISKIKSKTLSNRSIDSATGINLWGSKTTHYNELRMFLQTSSVEIDNLQTNLKNSDWTSIEQKAHGLKGLAGNLALPNLHGLFTTLEQTCSQQLNEECGRTIQKIKQEFSLITESITTSTNDLAATTNSTRPNITKLEFVQMLDTLEQHASLNKFDDEMLEKIATVNFVDNQQIRAVIQAFNDFEFEEALSMLKNMKVQLLDADSE
jgi:PAS domain S-box-containing protein